MTEPTEPRRAPQGSQFNAPPGWPPPPPDWVPPPGFQPDPTWGTAPADWQWWVPTKRHDTAAIPPPAQPAGDFTGATDRTQAFGEQPPARGPDFVAGPPPPIGLSSSGFLPPARQGSWMSQHKALAIVAIVVILLILGSVGTAGALYVANRGDGKPLAEASGSPSPAATGSAASKPAPQPSASETVDPSSPEHKAACAKAAGPSGKATNLVKDYSTKNKTNAQIIAAAPPIQADLNAAADGATGVLRTDLMEYAVSVGGFRTALVQGRDANTAAAKVVIYSIVLKAECDS